MFLVPAIHCESNEAVWLTKNEILYVIRNSRTIEIHTFSGILRVPATILDFYKLLNNNGFVFGESNSSLINLLNITNFDKKRGEVHFVHNSGRALSVAVSRRNKQYFSHL